MEIDSMSGAYSSHLAILSEDSSVKPIDSAKFKGYLGNGQMPSIFLVAQC